MYICTCEGINVHITYTLQVANSCGHIYLKRARLYCIITCAQGNIKKLSQILAGCIKSFFFNLQNSITRQNIVR